MSRKTQAFFLFLAVSAFAFAQKAPSPQKVLSAKDIDAFISGYPAMSAEITALDEKYPDLLALEKPNPETGSFGSTITQARGIKIPAEIKAITRKYGLGENGFEKIIVITFGTGVLAMEAALEGQSSTANDNPQMKEYLDSAKTQISEMKAAIHPDDLALINSKKEALMTMMGDGTAANP